MKPTPIQRACHNDFGGMFSFQNGLCMREKRHSKVFPKQAKKGLEQAKW